MWNEGYFYMHLENIYKETGSYFYWWTFVQNILSRYCKPGPIISARRRKSNRVIQGTGESNLEVDSSVPLTLHDPRDLGLICLVNKRKIHFRSILFGVYSSVAIRDLSDHGVSKEPKKRKILTGSFGFNNPISDFLKETHPELLYTGPLFETV